MNARSYEAGSEAGAGALAIDVADAIERTQLTLEVLVGFFTKFLVRADGEIADMERAFLAGDRDCVRKGAHRLHGAAGTLAMRRFALLAAMIEQAAADDTSMPALLTAIRSELDVCSAVAQRLAAAA